MKKNYKTIICSLLASVMVTAVIVPMSGCESTDTGSLTASEESAVISDAASQSSESETKTDSKAAEIKQGSLQAIYDELVKDGSGYKQFTGYYTTATFTEKIDGSKIVITAKGDGEYDPNGLWEYVQDGDYITYHNSNPTDYMGAILFMYVSSAVAESLGMDSDLMTGYLNGLNLLNMESEYFSQTINDDGTSDLKLYMASTFEMKELDQMYVTEELLSDNQPLSDESTSTANNVGKIAVLANGTKSSFKIIIREYGEFDDLAVKSVLNIVNVYQPDGYEKFADNFKTLENAETDEYTVKTDFDTADLSEYFDGEDEGDSYAIITFGKEETGE